MSEPFLFSDLVKNLPTVTDASGKNVLIADAQGALSLIAKALLTGIALKKTSSGAGLFDSRGVHLLFAYSESDVRKYCFALYIRKDFLGLTTSAAYIPIKENGLTMSAVNPVGTLSLTGANDIVHQVLSIGFDMT